MGVVPTAKYAFDSIYDTNYNTAVMFILKENSLKKPPLYTRTKYCQILDLFRNKKTPRYANTYTHNNCVYFCVPPIK